MKGFSLIELLIALFVFSILSVFSFVAINALSKNKDLLEDQNKSMLEMQKFLVFFEKDLNDCGKINKNLSNAKNYSEFLCEGVYSYSIDQSDVFKHYAKLENESSEKIILVHDVDSFVISLFDNSKETIGIKLKIANNELGNVERYYTFEQGTVPAGFTSLADLDTDEANSGSESQTNNEENQNYETPLFH